MAAGHDHNPLTHVLDHNTLEVPIVGREIALPNILGFQVTRFMVMELIVALLMIAILIPLARRVGRSQVTRGRFWNLFEAIVLFIRDGIARPAIDGATDHGDHGHGAHGEGHGHDQGHGHAAHGRLSDAFLPFLWTVFFFVLFCNLLGMIPGGASATGNINVTAVLALATLGAVITAGVKQAGPAGFWINLVPKLDVPGILKPILWGLMFVIEVAGLLIRHFVLAVRLFANMLAGHLVLGVILGFIGLATGYVTFVVTPGSLLMVLGLSMLELFVAVLQAYIFTFLAALFIGMAVHPH